MVLVHCTFQRDVYLHVRLNMLSVCSLDFLKKTSKQAPDRWMDRWVKRWMNNAKIVSHLTFGRGRLGQLPVFLRNYTCYPLLWNHRQCIVSYHVIHHMMQFFRE